MICPEEYQSPKEIPGQGICALQRMMFTTGLFVGINEVGYRGRYCYSNYADAKEALEQWDGFGDPPGPWIKWKGEGGDRSNPKALSDLF